MLSTKAQNKVIPVSGFLILQNKHLFHRKSTNIFFYFSIKNYVVGTQHKFSWRNKKQEDHDGPISLT